MRILLVEDEDLVRDVVAACLQDEGHDVVAFASAEGATEAVATGRFDLLVTDIRLPGLFTGWDVAERCRSIQPDLPIVYMTGYTHVDRRDLPDSLFVQKPLRPSALLRMITDYLAARSEAA